MLFTKEFYEIMEVFERTSKEFVRTGTMGLSREPKENWLKQNYYSDGAANDAFRVFLQGVSLGKSMAN